MRILGRAFPTFRQLIQFPNAQKEAPDEFSIESPVQPVYDLSRQNELALGFFAGMGDNSQVNTHAGGAASTVIATANVYATSFNFWERVGAEREKCWLWLHEVTARCGGISAFNWAFFSIEQAAVSNVAFQDHVRLVSRFNGLSESFIDSTGAAWTALVNASTFDNPPALIRLPALIPPGSSVNWISRATGTGQVVRVDMKLQALPIGVGPFGLR